MKTPRTIAAVCAAAALTTACGDDGTTTASAVDRRGSTPTATTKAQYVADLKRLGVDQYVGAIRPAHVDMTGLWESYFYDVTAGAVCIEGDDEFFASVRPSTTASEDVVLYLEGGGACWDEASCFGPLPLAVHDPGLLGEFSLRSGIFDRDRADNPLRTWNFVYASYCDGSVFSGDHIMQYGEHKAWHWGLRNLSAAVTVMKERFPNPRRILVTGSSAGGFGTFMAMGVVRATYPDQPIWVFNDSGPGIENKSLPEMNRGVRDSWRFTQFLPAACTRCNDQLAFLIDYMLDRDTDARVALFSYLNDAVIGSLFLRLYGEFPVLLRRVTDEIHDRHPETFRRFFAEGVDHTILGRREFYEPFPDGVTLRDWLAAFLEGGPGWVDRR